MTVFFVLTGLCHLVTATFARGIGIAGRAAILVGGLATLGVAAFALPSVAGSSSTHTLFAMIGFIFLAAWPLLGMRFRADLPWLVRPLGAILGTALLTAVCVWFLIIWSSHSSPVVGLVERVAADAEALWPAVVVTALWRRARRS